MEKKVCSKCGLEKSVSEFYRKGNGFEGVMEPHHLDGYNKFKEKRTDINNGILLCVNCHKEFHKIYGYGNNTKEQFKEFYKNKTNKEFEVVGF